MSQEERDRFWLLLQQTLGTTIGREVNTAIKQGRIDDAQGLLALQAATAFYRTQAAERDREGNIRSSNSVQQELLAFNGQGLTSQQREDMFRAAAQAGFSAQAIYGAQLELQSSENRQQGRSTDDYDEAMVAAQTSLRDFIRNIMIQRLNDLRNIEQRSRLADPRDEEVRQEKDRAVASLARLMGGTAPSFKEAEEAGRQDPRPGTVGGEQVADVTLATIWAETEARRALRAHQLDRVVPRHAA